MHNIFLSILLKFLPIPHVDRFYNYYNDIKKTQLLLHISFFLFRYGLLF